MFDENDDSDTEINFQTNNEYAKNYNQWRQKEMLNQLKAKYQGKIDSDDESSSSEDDDSDIELPDKVEMDFLKTLSSLKNKDPKIYDESVTFFDNTPIDPTVKKKKKEPTMFLKDYERKMLLEHGGGALIEEEEEARQQNESLTYVQEQDKLRKSLKSALDNVDDDEDQDDFGGLLQARVKSKEEEEKEEASFKLWLKGQKESLNNKEDENSLKPLKEHWNDPNLDAGEKFLRDYILNNRFKETHDANYVPTYDEIVHDDEEFSDDEQNVDKQEEFEHKFNYRFEDPDQEFLKRYPRTVEHSLRKTNDTRRVKRQEVKERKAREKQEKMEEIQKLKEMKRKEIEEKIKQLKEITGNTDVAFDDNDIDEDFDPEKHDRRMQALFNNDFYTGEEGDQKPEFPDLDEELGIERWDKMNKEQINENYDNDDGGNEYEYEPHAEDDDFNMDCDYDPTKSTQDELIENCKGKKKRKRKSKFAKAVSGDKPVFDPNDKSYEEYLDEYYKLDCEDIVGGIPCRFKYREVAPNNFGLTIEEILTANDKELNRWCSIKKSVQYRPDHVEKYDQIAYSKKAQNEALKRRILPSLYTDEEPSTSSGATNAKGKQDKQKQNGFHANVAEDQQEENINKTNGTHGLNEKKSKKKKSKEIAAEGKQDKQKQNGFHANVAEEEQQEENINNTNGTHGLNEKKSKKKKSKEIAAEVDATNTQNNEQGPPTVENADAPSEKKSKKKKKRNNTENNVDDQPGTKKMKLNQSLEEISAQKEGSTDEVAEQQLKAGKKNKGKRVENNVTELNENIADNEEKANVANVNANSSPTGKKKKKKKAKQSLDVSSESNKATTPGKQKGNAVANKNQNQKNNQNFNGKGNKVNKGANKPKNKYNNKNNKGGNSPACGFSDARLEAFGIKPKKFKNKLKYGKKDT